MSSGSFRWRYGALHRAIAILCVGLTGRPDLPAFAQEASTTAGQPARLSNEQLDSLVAPIALYPDPLLTQVLVASTYPLEIVQLHQWLQQHSGLKPKEVSDAVKKQDWDPSIQAMAVFPDVVKNMGENIKWTAELGNAFLAQQSEVMDAVQRMRAKAKDAGYLKSTPEQKVETREVANQTVVVIEPASPEVVYVPSYNPMAIWGAPVYPYPSVYYPAGGYLAGGLIGFGLGTAIGSAWGGSGWGWGYGWRGNDIDINVNNAFVRHYNRNRGNRRGAAYGDGNRWRHNPEHRGGAPYGDRNTAGRFGGATRAPGAIQGPGQSVGRSRDAGDFGSRARSAANAAGPGLSGDRIGDRRTSDGSFGRGRDNAFGGGSPGAIRSSRDRGSFSMGPRGGGGFSRGAGGMSRGGGGMPRGGGGMPRGGGGFGGGGRRR